MRSTLPIESIALLDCVFAEAAAAAAAGRRRLRVRRRRSLGHQINLVNNRPTEPAHTHAPLRYARQHAQTLPVHITHSVVSTPPPEMDDMG